jgi:hypothetical protein
VLHILFECGEVALELGAQRGVPRRERSELGEVGGPRVEAVPTRQARPDQIEALQRGESAVAVGPEVGPGDLRL